MTCQRLEPHDLLRRVDPASLGLSSTRELLDRPLSWIGQQRAEAAARFGLGMALPGYNLLVVGEVGTGRTSLMRQLMLDERVVQAVAQGRFHIHAIDTVAEGMALLSGLSWGDLGPSGYPAGSVLGRAQARLNRFRQALGAAGSHHEQAAHKRRNHGGH